MVGLYENMEHFIIFIWGLCHRISRKCVQIDCNNRWAPEAQRWSKVKWVSFTDLPVLTDVSQTLGLVTWRSKIILKTETRYLDQFGCFFKFRFPFHHWFPCTFLRDSLSRMIWHIGYYRFLSWYCYPGRPILMPYPYTVWPPSFRLVDNLHRTI